MMDNNINQLKSNMMTLFHIPKNKKNAGFTLIELLITISIIAILVGIVTATFSSVQAKARDSRRKTDLDAFKKALELYKGDTDGSSYYPRCTTTVGVTTYCLLNTNASFNPTLSADYLRDFPKRLKNHDYYYEPLVGCISATATTDAGCETYEIIVCLENTDDSDQDSTTKTVCETFAGAGNPAASYTIHNP